MTLRRNARPKKGAESSEILHQEVLVILDLIQTRDLFRIPVVEAPLKERDTILKDTMILGIKKTKKSVVGNIHGLLRSEEAVAPVSRSENLYTQTVILSHEIISEGLSKLDRSRPFLVPEDSIGPLDKEKPVKSSKNKLRSSKYSRGRSGSAKRNRSVEKKSAYPRPIRSSERFRHESRNRANGVDSRSNSAESFAKNSHGFSKKSNYQMKKKSEYLEKDVEEEKRMKVEMEMKKRKEEIDFEKAKVEADKISKRREMGMEKARIEAEEAKKRKELRLEKEKMKLEEEKKLALEREEERKRKILEEEEKKMAAATTKNEIENVVSSTENEAEIKAETQTQPPASNDASALYMASEQERHKVYEEQLRIYNEKRAEAQKIYQAQHAQYQAQQQRMIAHQQEQARLYAEQQYAYVQQSERNRLQEEARKYAEKQAASQALEAAANNKNVSKNNENPPPPPLPCSNEIEEKGNGNNVKKSSDLKNILKRIQEAMKAANNEVEVIRKSIDHGFSMISELKNELSNLETNSGSKTGTESVRNDGGILEGGNGMSRVSDGDDAAGKESIDEDMETDE
eukprot:CAMPEP_0171456536 /NCGR_PEP_ID=MMETSP0945-20130129/2978_1 /TAXON_ID=109269 /ORGANISM="Vaucheria litorea, Strain CCMP2940" /LENGTH=570 /DNA_ID=CAMNT_0011981969 /DNA_START=142 /DNA_END=1853 /DNA_ORIENTATION=+